MKGDKGYKGPVFAAVPDAREVRKEVRKELDKERKDDDGGFGWLNDITVLNATSALSNAQQSMVNIVKGVPKGDGSGGTPADQPITHIPATFDEDARRVLQWCANSTLAQAQASYNADSAIRSEMMISLFGGKSKKRGLFGGGGGGGLPQILVFSTLANGSTGLANLFSFGNAQNFDLDVNYYTLG